MLLAQQPRQPWGKSKQVVQVHHAGLHVLEEIWARTRASEPRRALASKPGLPLCVSMLHDAMITSGWRKPGRFLHVMLGRVYTLRVYPHVTPSLYPCTIPTKAPQLHSVAHRCILRACCQSVKEDVHSALVSRC